MKNKVMIMVVFFLIVCLSLAKAEGFKEGQWSMTMVTKMDNMPPEVAAAMKKMENMPPEARAMMKQMQGKMNVEMNGAGEGMKMTISQCITKKDPIPQSSKLPPGCEQTHETNGNTVNFHMNCNHEGMQIISSGQMTYEGDSVHGQIKSHQVMAGKSMDSTVDINGKYLGPCSKTGNN